MEPLLPSPPHRLLTFESEESAHRVIQELNGVLLEGRKIFLREDRSAIDQQEGVVVFVGNLPWIATSQSLKETFADYNPIDVHVKTNMAGKSRGKVMMMMMTMMKIMVVVVVVQHPKEREREGG